MYSYQCRIFRGRWQGLHCRHSSCTCRCNLTDGATQPASNMSLTRCCPLLLISPSSAIVHCLNCIYSAPLTCLHLSLCLFWTFPAGCQCCRGSVAGAGAHRAAGCCAGRVCGALLSAAQHLVGRQAQQQRHCGGVVGRCGAAAALTACTWQRGCCSCSTYPASAWCWSRTDA